MKLTKQKLKQIINEEFKNLVEAEEAWVLERSGVTFAEKFVVGGSPQDPKFGSLGQAKTFGSKEAAKSFAAKSDIHVSVKSKESLKEAHGGALGKFPDRYGSTGPVRGSKKQRGHETRLAGQMEERSAKEAEREELRQILGHEWEVNVRMLEDRYQLTVHRAYAGE